MYFPSAGSAKNVGYQANQEQDDEYKEANSGDLGGSESDNSKAEDSGK
jgi:hypothetical protein